jgi:hypothetical protein
MTGSTKCGNIATYGPFLQKLGLCNPVSDILSVVGAAELNTSSVAPPPTPADVGTVNFTAASDSVTATLSGTALRLTDHVAALLLVDDASGLPVALDYGLDTMRTADAGGLLASVQLPFRGKPVPSKVRVYLMIDVSQVASTTLTIP